MQFNGFVENVYANPTQWKNKDGSTKMMYAMVVDGVRYSTKNKDVTHLKDCYVSFEATQNGDYWNADPESIKRIEPAKQETSPAKAKMTGGSSTTSASNDRQDSIIYQSSRKDAIEMVNAMLAAGLIDFGKAKGAQKMELYEVYVDHYTVRLFDDCKRLAPPEHANPVEAEAPERATELAKPARRAKAAMDAVADAGFGDDDIPF